MGGVPNTSAGNVANSQPHAPRLIRAGTPPSISNTDRNARQGCKGLAWGGAGGVKPLLWAAKQPCCEHSEQPPLLVEKRISE